MSLEFSLGLVFVVLIVTALILARRQAQALPVAEHSPDLGKRLIRRWGSSLPALKEAMLAAEMPWPAISAFDAGFETESGFTSGPMHTGGTTYNPRKYNTDSIRDQLAALPDLGDGRSCSETVAGTAWYGKDWFPHGNEKAGTFTLAYTAPVRASGAHIDGGLVEIELVSKKGKKRAGKISKTKKTSKGKKK